MQFRRDTTTLIQEKDESEGIIFGSIPFDVNSSKVLKPVLQRFNIRPAFRSKKMKSMMHYPKDQTAEHEKSGIYRITCEPGCDERYIGQTRRGIGVRMKEHCLQFRNKAPEKSAVARHLLEKHHLLPVAEDCLKLMKSVSVPAKLLFWESLMMRLEKRL